MPSRPAGSLPGPVDPMDPDNAEQSRWFSQEVQPHEPALRRWLRALFPSLPDVDDIVQESYVRLLQARNEGRVGHAKAYLFATARNFVLDLFRRERVVAFEPVANPEELSVLEDGPDIADAVSHQQDLELLADAVRTLPGRCRQVLTLRLLYGLSHKQIAAELRISPHTVKAQLAKGMRRCADYFEQHGDRHAVAAFEGNY